MSDTASSPLTPPRGGAALRMYRHGQGDCCLLAIDRRGERRPAYLLIDCGVHPGQPDREETMAAVVDDVRRSTGGRLDVVVVTLPHADHVAGFLGHDGVPFDVDRFWTAWIEDEDDTLADRIRRVRRRAASAVDSAVTRMSSREDRPDAINSATLKLADRMRRLRRLMGATSRKAGESAFGDSAGAQSSTLGEQVVRSLKNKARQTAYLAAGCKPLRLPGVSARVYILDPSRAAVENRNSARRERTRRGASLAAVPGLDSFAQAVAFGLSPGSRPEDDEKASGQEAENRRSRELFAPFAAEAGLDLRSAVTNVPEPDDAEAGLARAVAEVVARYRRERRRRIDDDWLFAAEALAARLENDAHESSLVLAVELGPPGRGPVLLFSGDSRLNDDVRNGLEWTIGRRRITAADLLRRTVVCKISRGADFRTSIRGENAPCGLSLLPDGVVALLAVDPAATIDGTGAEVVSADSYEALRRKTLGNVLRSDDTDPSAARPRRKWSDASNSPGVSWRASAASKPDGGRLYYELSVVVRSRTKFNPTESDHGR